MKYINYKSEKIIYSLILGIVLSIFALMELDYILVHTQINSLFLFDYSYLTDYLWQLMGMGSYLSSFIIQFFYYPALGVVLLGLLFAVSCYCLSSSAGNRDPLMLACAPLLLIFTGYNEADFMLVVTCLFVCSVAIKLWSVMSLRVKIIAAIPLIITVYYITGMMAVLMFGYMIGWFVTQTNNRKLSLITAVCLLISMPAIPYLVAHLLVIPTSVAYTAWFKDSAVSGYWLWIALTVFMIYSFVVPGKWFDRKKLWMPMKIAAFAIIIVGAMVVCYKQLNPDLRDMMRIEQAAAGEKWDDVLQMSMNTKAKSKVKTYLTNVALFRKGELLNKLLDYEQSFGESGLFFQWSATSPAAISNNDLVFINVGMVNEALRYSFETWEGKGYSSLALRKLVAYSKIQGNHQFAERFDKRLNNSMFYSSGKDSIVYRPLYHAVCDNDCVVATGNLSFNLEVILATDSSNYAAMEYLIACYLLSNRVEDLAIILPAALEMYDGKLPRIYEEALMIWKVSKPEEFAKLNYTISESTITRFENFNRTLYGAQSSNARNNAHQAYGNSYWFYLSFISPNGPEIISSIKTKPVVDAGQQYDSAS